MEIFVCFDLNEAQTARVREIAAGDVVHFHGEFAAQAALEPGFGACEVAFGNAPPGWLTQTDKLRWMQLESVGFGEYEQLDWQRLGRRVTLTNLPGFFAEPVAESALAGILGLYRGIDRLVRLRLDRSWVGDPLRTELRTLAGASVVLFGYGSINRRLAELLGPFGCRIERFDKDRTIQDLDAALPHADVVVSVVPETAATVAVFDEARLGLLNSAALFVNFGRGSVVDEDALVRALRDGRIGGAVIDVTLREPLADDHGLWTCPNTIVTQHTGGGTQDEIDRKIDVFADNLRRFRDGKPPAGIVDFERGY